MRMWPGRSYPLGATWDGAGVNFALFVEQHDAKVELCFFDPDEPGKETGRFVLREYTDQVRHGYFPDVQPGQLYGYRVHGPYDPAKGLRFNGNKLLLDPYAKAIGRNLTWHDSLFGYKVGDATADLSFDERDSAPYAPLAAVVDTAFTWGDDRTPNTPWHKTLIYELHVKGFTQRMPGVPEKQRGTYLGVASEAAVKHLLDLGVTAVELMPVHYYLYDRHLLEKKLTNYWGYNSLGYFAPHPDYASTEGASEAVQQFKRMVRGLHASRTRSYPRRGVQPYGRGQSDGADAVDARCGQRLLLPPVAGRPALLHGLHRLRQHAEYAPSARAATGHGQPAPLGSGVSH